MSSDLKVSPRYCAVFTDQISSHVLQVFVNVFPRYCTTAVLPAACRESRKVDKLQPRAIVIETTSVINNHFAILHLNFSGRHN